MVGRVAAQYITLERPKSAILRSSRFSPHSIFSGLRSRCTMPRSCKYATDSSNGRMSLAASSSVNLRETERETEGTKRESEREIEGVREGEIEGVREGDKEGVRERDR
jgi:hypothetical protein